MVGFKNPTYTIEREAPCLYSRCFPTASPTSFLAGIGHRSYPQGASQVACVTGFLRAKPRTEIHLSTALNPWINGAWVNSFLNLAYSYLYYPVGHKPRKTYR